MTPRRYQWRPRRRRGLSWVVWSTAIAIAASALGSGCSWRESNATLEQRVRRYWELKQSKRWEEVYDGFLDPMLKAKLSREAFLKKRLLAFDVLTFEISETREDGEETTVTVTSEVNIPILSGPGGAVQVTRKTVTTKDGWVRRDGTWYVRLSE